MSFAIYQQTWAHNRIYTPTQTHTPTQTQSKRPKVLISIAQRTGTASASWSWSWARHNPVERCWAAWRRTKTYYNTINIIREGGQMHTHTDTNAHTLIQRKSIMAELVSSYILFSRAALPARQSHTYTRSTSHPRQHRHQHTYCYTYTYSKVLTLSRPAALVWKAATSCTTTQRQL